MLGCWQQYENLKRIDATKWFHRDKDDDNDDFSRMQTANESDNGQVRSRAEVFVAFEKWLRWFKLQKERNSMQLLMRKELRDLAAEQKLIFESID